MLARACYLLNYLKKKASFTASFNQIWQWALGAQLRSELHKKSEL
jgi:hypothetical protein